MRVKSGDLFNESGRYGYSEHVDPDDDRGCKAMESEKDKFFRKGIRARHIGACSHPVWWIRKD